MEVFSRILIFSVGILTVVGPLVRSQEVCVVPKCCPIGQTYPGPKKSCQNSSLQFEPNISNGSEVIESSNSMILNIIVGNPCQYGKYRLEPDQNSDDEFYILCNGSLFAPFQSEQMFKISHYCLDSFLSSDGERVVTLPLLCSPPPPPPPTIFERMAMAIYPVGLLISVPFLILTIMVFGGFPELRDTQGKSLCCHCVCLTVAYLALAIVMLMGNSLSQTACIILAFVIQFSFVSCFFWLNILCIDTWWRLTRKPCWSAHQERLRFIYYSLWAWSIPLICVIITMVMELTPIVPDAYLKPNFGQKSCWFHKREAAFPYFYAPIGVLLAVNVCLFLLSISSVQRAVEQREEEEVGLNTEQDPCSYSKASRRIEMFTQCLILFLVMGLNWILELLSYFVGGPIEVWILTDTLNSLQGVIIYFVFIVRVPRVSHLASSRLVPTCGFLCGQSNQE